MYPFFQEDRKPKAKIWLVIRRLKRIINVGCYEFSFVFLLIISNCEVNQQFYDRFYDIKENEPICFVDEEKLYILCIFGIDAPDWSTFNLIECLHLILIVQYSERPYEQTCIVYRYIFIFKCTCMNWISNGKTLLMLCLCFTWVVFILYFVRRMELYVICYLHIYCGFCVWCGWSAMDMV